MPKLRRVSGRQAIRILEKQTPEGTVGCVVPLHRELAIGTLRGILKQAGVTPDEFMENL